ncbi:MAG: nucleotidyltransferase family protein [Thaumarchaeota archaeon]|nr:nucleotidyltransferase family protein [Nitrososphaerota archaeon]
MKAVILAGGKGTRARPFTDYSPKAMIPVYEKPLIFHIINHLYSFDFISEIIIVCDLSGFGGQIKNYFEKSKIRFIQDSSSGTAGDLVHLAGLVKRESFVLWFADNLCALDLGKMYKHYTNKKSMACIATRQFRKEETGFAQVDDGVVSQFIEKPIIKMENHECTGIYILSGKIIDIIKSKSKKNLNLSYDILQELSKKGQVSSFDIGKTPWVDVESPSIIQRKSDDIKKIIKSINHNM